ncbi:MAG: two-component sensor histidine kinase [Lachnospiraceae bacterium]|nr:two-component sensor histidine kinase [Lachnospiraceae bacterium]
MKKKINTLYILLSVSAILLTLIATTCVYYGFLRKEVLDNLKNYAHLLKTPIVEEAYDSDIIHTAKEDQIRITVIHKDGEVLFDNEVNIEEMDNHSERPEVQEALQSGEGVTVRRSDTLDKSTFYYAFVVDNDKILRVAKETGSIWSILGQAFPFIALIAGILIISSILFSGLLTRSIVKPIETLANNLDHVETVSTYKELMPFLNTIQRQHDDILKSAKIRQEFTANVSHELKTPLTSISGYSELIENGMASSGDVQRFAGEIHKNAQRLLTLINDILRLSELDDSEKDTMLSFETVDLYNIAENCVNMLTLNAEKHQVQMTMEGASCQVHGNRQMLEELIYNLCDNAIRYNNPGGTVWVSVRESDDLQVELIVKDTGIGISKEHQTRIFERFYRVDKSRSKSTGGTGLGLAIVKHIVSQHHAEMKLESEIGVGTTISIQFPEK